MNLFSDSDWHGLIAVLVVGGFAIGVVFCAFLSFLGNHFSVGWTW